MKVLMLTWKSFGNEDILAAFHKLGHTVIEYPFSHTTDRNDEESIQSLSKSLRANAPDFLFSFNYFPVASISCKNAGIPYVSWIYDSPYVKMYHYSINFPTNLCFTFDKAQYLEFHNAGIHTIHYLPLAANTERLNAMTNFKLLQDTKWMPKHEVSFVGSLYTEKHQFFSRMNSITPYTRGYLDGLMAAQRQISGYNFVQELLHKNILEDMQNSLPMHTGTDSVESLEYLFAQYVINRQITSLERQDLLSAIADNFALDLYTKDENFKMERCTNHGPIDYYDMAPYVFKTSKININISLRSIQSGIPLRCFDVMGAGGFLISNFQPDFLDFFTPEEDFVFYDTKKDLIDKISYYLNHEDERQAIAYNGLKQIKAHHTYEHRIKEIISHL